ncbi:response regulator [Pedobacter terrae]|uniref:response regulator n=1 Tax=Pedobacter terrae TaxID=405671 RepID=UPI002FF4D17B
MKKILVIDDSDEILAICQFILEDEGFKVCCTSETDHVIAVAKKFLPDLILLDVNLGCLHGSEIYDLLKVVDETKEIPVIIMSSSERCMVEKKWRNMPGRFIGKPFSLNELTKTVESQLFPI